MINQENCKIEDELNKVTIGSELKISSEKEINVTADAVPTAMPRKEKSNNRSSSEVKYRILSGKKNMDNHGVSGSDS